MIGINKFTLSSLLAALIITFAGMTIFSEPAWADNSGGDGHDSSSTGGESTNEGHSCSNNGCNSVVYSGATAVVEVTVTEETKTEGIYSPSVCTNAACSSFNYTPSEPVIKTGDAEIGSTYYLVGMFADADGVVYLDGQRVEVKKGDLLTYIPVVSDGSNGLSSLWSLVNSRRATEYGNGMTFDQFITLYHSMLPFLNKEFSLTDLVGFGGLLKKLGLKPEEICELGLCDNTPPPPATPSCHVGSHAGWTDGKVQVNNFTTSTGWKEEVWARPGDTIRFSMYYCWGVGAVGGSADNDPSSPWAIYPDGNATTYGSAVNNVWFEVSASPSNNYLFGVDEKYLGELGKTTLNDPHKASIGEAVTGFSSEVSSDSATSDYNFLYYSPSVREEDADSHDCSIFDFGGYTFTGSHGFQIPGATADGCNASNHTGSLSEAGKKISQTLDYSYDTAWQRYRHNETGDCDSKCTWQEANPAPGVIGKETYKDKDMNTLIERNANKLSDPYQSLEAALNASVNDWGLIKKWANDTNTHGTATLGDCNYSLCSASKWSSYPYYSPNCGCNTGRSCYVCETGHDQDGRCTTDEKYHTNDEAACGCEKYNSGPCWGKYDSTKSQHSPTRPGKSHYKPPKNYSTGQQQLGTKSSTATVNIPYSYRTNVTSNIQEGEVIYLGETVHSSFTASITPRVVTNVRPSEAYATVVPGYIKAVEFVVGADSNLSPATDSSNALSPATGSSNAGGTDPCAFYSSLGMISECNTIWTEEGQGGMLNEEGRYAGKTYSHAEDRVVPDIYPVGSKYCVAVGISTSDSHGQPDTQVVSGMSSPSGWRISGISCRTIAKKPNFQIWNGNFYTKGAVRTSITKKRVGARLGDPIQPTGYFGSWEEYIISAKGNVSGMSSAAGLGYYGEYNKRMLGLQGGTSPDKSFCELSHMTIANSNCANEDRDSGRYYAGNSQIEDSMNTVLERIRSRYLTSTHGIVTLENGATHIYPDQANISTSELYRIAHGALANTQLSDSVIRQTKSAINSEAEQTTSNYASNVLIIHVDGTLTIDTDICTGDGTCGSDSPLILANRNNDIYDNIYSLPQIIIIADAGIVIKNNVTQIDAWLITNGNINTCNGLSYNSNGFSADTCAKQLIVNGPVFANSLTLVRNSGADGGAGTGNAAGGDPITFNLSDDGSIQPGEIFNLRPDVLYWAYSQAQRFSQANVTYSRELAPRY